MKPGLYSEQWYANRLQQQGLSEQVTQACPLLTNVATAAPRAANEGWPVFEAMLRSSKLPLPVYEYQFHHVRKWRLDMAWPDQKIGIEVNGGIWARGNSGHSSGTGIMRDMEKSNAAQLLGWTLLSYTPDTLATAVDDLKALLK